ncbi:MAG TPA: hypothetical protein VLS89_16545 [Candidatus Nanopelagicales bacterium]|nr:hypothetical protein [Candidatus Nanopelagicales bacterium]
MLQPARLASLLAAVSALLLAPGARGADLASTLVSPGVRGGPPTVTPPVRGEPVRLLTAPGGDIFAQMEDGTVVSIPAGEQVLDVRAEGEVRTSTTRVFCAVGPGPRVACLRAALKSEANGQPGSQELSLIDSDGEREVIASGSGEGYDVAPLGIHVGSDGKIRFAYAETITQQKQAITRQYVVAGGDREELPVELGNLVSNLANVGGGDRVDPPLQMVEFDGELWLVHRADSAVVVHPPGEEPIEVASSSLHDIRPVVGRDGWFYVFYHEPSTATARVAASKDGRTWKSTTLDGKESGWQLDAAAGGEGVYAAFYYFRNPFNKGLRVAAMREGKPVGSTVTVFREDRFNAGWHPHLAIAGDGTTWLTWQSNVEEERRAWSRFKEPEALREKAIGPSSGWEEGYKNYFLQTGAGGWLNLWHLASATPSLEDANGVLVTAPEYDVGAALLLSANIEARWGFLDFGLSYAQGIVDDAAESIEDSTGILNGSIKIDEVFAGHDIKVGMLWGRYRGTASAVVASGEGGEMEIKTNYIDTQLLALNKWRVKYGLSFTRYTLPTLVYAWSAAEGVSDYGYAGTFLRDVSFNDVALLIGYSKLDYAAKYENHYNGLILDGSIGAGLSFYSFEAVPTDNGNLESGLTFHMRSNVMLGWLYFHRWQSLRGFGLYVRPSYTAEFGFTGLPSAPSAREDTAGASTYGAVSLLWVRHGPWLDAGAVW